MALTNAQILTEVNNRTNRSETDIDLIRNAVLNDLSNRWNYLEKTSSVTMDVAGQSKALPTGYRKVKSVIDPNGNTLQPTTIAELLNHQAVASATATTSLRWAQFNNSLYVHPKPTGQTVFTVYHSYESVDVDDFDDCFDEAIIEGCCYKLYESLGLLGEVPAAMTHKNNFDEQVKVLTERFADRA